MPLTDAEMLADIERLAEEAQASPAGPDYRAIVTTVAEENGVPFERLRGLWLDSWNMSGVA